jgi:dTDP-4-dehydrorhamnose reductase
MRLAVTGKSGQIVSALRERAGDTEILTLGRPELDLVDAANVTSLLEELSPDAIISSAAYTAVDKAESEPELVQAINCLGPGHLSAAAYSLGIPIVHISTDYVFDGSKPSPYVETDPTSPLGVYGTSKLAGEHAVARATANHAILRTAWVYSPFGNNFLKTMLRLAADREKVRVVGDQRGNPTSALDIADAIMSVSRNLVDKPNDASLRGIFHVTASGEADWAEFAREIFAASAAIGGPAAGVKTVSTADYPTPAERPANSRLDCRKLTQNHGTTLPHWREAMPSIVARLVRPLSK